MDKAKLFADFEAADAEFEAALVAAYGKRAGTARYSNIMSNANPELAAITKRRHDARSAWERVAFA